MKSTKRSEIKRLRDPAGDLTVYCFLLSRTGTCMCACVCLHTHVDNPYLYVWICSTFVDGLYFYPRVDSNLPLFIFVLLDHGSWAQRFIRCMSLLRFSSSVYF